ncbi:hypothetical protein KSP40_PGU012395 [Platanthera guangdongensis]|uniref:Methionine adenosyltransferase 2 subunit beta n=1 Tax=Platanthera guangdongensis TaxID=2320717 RepID=A0ABR2MIW4_9ASPA
MDSGGKKRILVVGGSGFLGQHLLHELDTACGNMPPYDVAFAHHRPAPPPELLVSLSCAAPFSTDLVSGECFECSSGTVCQPHVIINCAALSIPRACEVDPAAAMDINVPTSLIDWLSSFRDDSILLIHLSTDQGIMIAECLEKKSLHSGDLLRGADAVDPLGDDSLVYEGVKSFYKEEDETAPVNMYGKSKVAAEKFISENCSNFVILRCSIIYGPQTISPVTKSLPIQWINSVLSCGKEVEFFHDEFRCPVYVKDVVSVISTLTKKWLSDGNQMKLVLNVGGPDRLSRAQMAEAVADYRGYDCSLIKPVSASSINRGVASPADISMDVSRLVRLLGINPISFKDGVRFTLENCSWPL